MANIVLYSPYYKGSENNMGGYARYLATREGVVVPRNENLNRPETTKQKNLIKKMLKDFPECTELLEYKDYISKPTIENASEFITRVFESNVQTEGLGYYIQYMATRPGAEKIAKHGLFSDNGTQLVLSKVEKELNEYDGNVWTHIISIRREDAARLGFDNVKAWQDLLSAKRNEIAKNMKINPKNFKWYAAFHNEGHHPHVHMIAYSTDATEPYLTREGIRNIKSCLAKEIFKNDLIQIYDEQISYRNELKSDSKEIAEELIANLKHGNCENDNVAQLMMKLNEMLKKTSGKKVYGYLSPEIKAVVNMIVDEFEKDDRIKSLYDLWYIQKDKITSNYTDEKSKRTPLSQNKEFKSIRNMVIQEAMTIDKLINDLDEKISTNPIMMSEGENESYVRDKNTIGTNNSRQISAILVMRLLGYLGNLFSNKLEINNNNKTQRIDKKQYRQIEEKKMAQGLKN
ncbi:MAG: MobP3 family relaxase [Candidatus Gastranaerophilaceae bacterium]